MSEKEHPAQAWLNAISSQLQESSKYLTFLFNSGGSTQQVNAQQQVTNELRLKYNELLREQYRAWRTTPEQASLLPAATLKERIAAAEKVTADQLERQLKLMKEIQAQREADAVSIARAVQSATSSPYR